MLDRACCSYLPKKKNLRTGLFGVNFSVRLIFLHCVCSIGEKMFEFSNLYAGWRVEASIRIGVHASHVRTAASTPHANRVRMATSTPMRRRSIASGQFLQLRIRHMSIVFGRFLKLLMRRVPIVSGRNLQLPMRHLSIASRRFLQRFSSCVVCQSYPDGFFNSPCVSVKTHHVSHVWTSSSAPHRSQ